VVREGFFPVMAYRCCGDLRVRGDERRDRPVALARAMVRLVVGWLDVCGGIDRRDAYAVGAMVVSFGVTQVDLPGRLVGFLGPTAHGPAVFCKLVFGGRVAGRAVALVGFDL